MANLGNIGVNSAPYRLGAIQSFPGLNRIALGTEDIVCGISKSSTEGDPNTPSMKVSGPFRRRFLWGVDAGTRTIKIRVKYSADSGTGKRPKLYVIENSDIGVTATSAEAPAGAGSWQTIGPITVTPSGAGALAIELAWDHVFDIAQVSYWDTIEVT